MAFRPAAEHNDVAGPGNGRSRFGQGVVVAVGQKDAHAPGLKADKGVAQGQTGAQAAVRAIVNVAGKEKEIRLLAQAKIRQPLQGDERTFAQQPRQAFRGPGPAAGGSQQHVAYPAERGVQVQIRRVDKGEFRHVPRYSARAGRCFVLHVISLPGDAFCRPLFSRSFNCAGLFSGRRRRGG